MEEGRSKSKSKRNAFAMYFDDTNKNACFSIVFFNKLHSIRFVVYVCPVSEMKTEVEKRYYDVDEQYR